MEQLIAFIVQHLANAVTWFLIVLFLIVPPLRYHAAYVLWRALKIERKKNLPTGVTLERFIIASTGSIAATILTILGTVRGLFLLGFIQYEIPQPLGILLLGIAMTLMMVPAFIWEAMYQTGRLER